MTTQAEHLSCACQELGLRIEVPFNVELRAGLTISARALLPELGAENGMIVVSHYDDLYGASDEIQSAGYGYSVLEDPLEGEVYDRDSYMELFLDWGWGNEKRAEAKPVWMN
jgi:hypothetical protein